jgi:hypothetical protein
MPGGFEEKLVAQAVRLSHPWLRVEKGGSVHSTFSSLSSKIGKHLSEGELIGFVIKLSIWFKYERFWAL